MLIILNFRVNRNQPHLKGDPGGRIKVALVSAVRAPPPSSGRP